MVLEKAPSTISILGCGWLGEPLANYLLANGFKIKASTTSEEKLHRLIGAGIETYQLSLESLNETMLPFFDAEILVVNIPSKNMEGFKKLISFIKKSTLKKVLFVSSTSVYRDNNGIITEDTMDSFSESPLLEIEQLFEQNYHFETTILRFGGLFGYSRKPGNFFPLGKGVLQPDAPVNMIHRDDCIAIMYQIIKQNVFGKTFNACADSHPTKREFYTKATEIVGNPTPNFIVGETLSFKIISNDKLKKELNYKFKYADILKALEM
ncbi:MAG: dTDP-glucose 4,6-dehydratase [Flavobacteriaceae bacterium]|jgi:nucleoside-diphosphate-sugar epimerase|nr:dTDP-glucose 4,6-dehydratase [Flavobacteriaceae bacterium]